VALWFWVPLVLGWIKKDDAATKAPMGAAPNSASVTVSTPGGSAAVQANSATKGNKAEGAKHPWHQLIQWMNNDPRTSATNPMPGRRDPFVSPQNDAAKAEAEAKLDKKTLEATPQGWGVVLSATAVGAHRRAAQINGKSYRQGETVRLTKDGQQIEFILAAVHPRRIVLQRNGEQFELALPVTAPSGRIEVSRDGQ
jgi:hypothetical protein